jgi:acyl phosphate:glycerol-3-phosphate acyltransferase
MLLFSFFLMLVVPCLGAYLLGSIPFGVIISKKMYSLDPRQHGSGNIGTTNILRVVGKKAAILVFLCDSGKAFLSVFLYQIFLNGPLMDWGQVLIGFCCVIGHVWSVFLGFRGGKAIACIFGVALAWSVWLALILVLIWGIFVYCSKISAWGGIGASLFLPILVPVFVQGWFVHQLSYLLVVVVVFAHRSNLKCILAEQEKKHPVV